MIISLLEKYTKNILDIKKANMIEEYDFQLQYFSELMVGKKIDDLMQISKMLDDERNNLEKSRIINYANNNQLNQVNSELVDREEFLNVQLTLIENIKAQKKEYYRQSIYPVERNILEHPLFNVSTPKDKRLKLFRNEVNEINLHINGFRRLFYCNKNGILLTTFDMKLFIGLLKLWEIKGRCARFVFRFVELIDVIYEVKSGGLYQLIEKSLKSLSQTSIIMDEYFNPKTSERIRTRAYNLIRYCHIDRLANKVTIELSRPIHESMEGENVIKISMVMFNDLQPVSRILYVQLTNCIKNGIFSIDLWKLIHHIGLQDRNRLRAVQTITRSLQELKGTGFISSFDIIKLGNKVKILRYTPSDWVNHSNSFEGNTM